MLLMGGLHTHTHTHSEMGDCAVDLHDRIAFDIR
jgi:hypothetical protein